MKKTLIGLLLGSLPLAAQAVTLPEAVEQAVLRNPEVLMRWHQYRAASEDVSSAKGGYLPRVDAQGYVGREWQDYPTTGNRAFNHPGASIELRQMLFDGFATRSEVRRGGYVKLTRYYDLLAVSDTVALETARAYLDVLRYRKLAELARDNWATHKEIYDQIVERVQAGVGRRVDLEQAAGRVALAESNWLTEASNLHDVSARYERLVGVQPPKNMEDAPGLAEKMPAVSDTLPTALRQNPAFLAAIANLRAARAQMDSYRSANYPTLELKASEGIDRNRDGVGGGYQDGKVQLVLNYNLFRGGADSAKIRSASESLDASFNARDKSCRDIRQETRIAHNDAQRLMTQIRYLEQHQLSTEKARDAYRQQFDIGQRTLLDVLDTENELFEARRSLIRAEIDLQLAHIRVLTQTHQILPSLKLTPIDSSQPDDDLGGAELEDARVACGLESMAPIELDKDAAMAARPPRSAAKPSLVPQSKPAEPARPVVSALAVPMAQGKACTINEKQVVSFLEDWVAAWSSKNFDLYLSYFSDRFEAPKDQPVQDWRPFRKTRLARVGPITLSVKNVVPKVTGPDTAEVSFSQFYSADGFVDNVEKTLDLQNEDCKLKILHERVTKGRIY